MTSPFTEGEKNGEKVQNLHLSEIPAVEWFSLLVFLFWGKKLPSSLVKFNHSSSFSGRNLSSTLRKDDFTDMFPGTFPARRRKPA